MIKQIIATAIFSMILTACGGSSNTTPDDDSGELVVPLVNFIDSTRFADCGSTTLTNTIPSLDSANPTPVGLGLVLDVPVEPTLEASTTHYWLLPSGSETQLILDIDSNPLELTTVSTATIALFEGIENPVSIFLEDADIALESRKTRHHNFFFNANPENTDLVVTLKLTLPSNVQGYQIGVLEAVDNVPTPYFSDCPVVNVLAANTTYGGTLLSDGLAGDEVWYLHTVPANAESSYEFRIDVNTTRIDGTVGDVSYEMHLLTNVAEDSGASKVLAELESTVGTSTSAPFIVNIGNDDNDGETLVWVRLVKANSDLDFRITLTP